MKGEEHGNVYRKYTLIILYMIIISVGAGFADAPYGGAAYAEFSFGAAGLYSYLDYAGTPDHVLSIDAFMFSRLIFAGGWGFGLMYAGGLAFLESLGIAAPPSFVMDAGIGPCFAFRFFSETASVTVMPAAHFILANGSPMFGAMVAGEIVILLSRLGGVHLGLSTAFDFIPGSASANNSIAISARVYLGLTMFFPFTGPARPREEARYHIPEENLSPD